MKRTVRALSALAISVMMLGLGSPASAEETVVGPATVEGGDVSADGSGVTVAPITVTVADLDGPCPDPTRTCRRTAEGGLNAGPTDAEIGPILVGPDGARIAPTTVCIEERPNFFFGTVCNLGVDQEGVRIDATDAHVGGTTLCFFFFPGVFCQAETGFVKVNDAAIHVEPTALTGSTQAGDSGVTMTEADECIEAFLDFACYTLGRVAVDGSGVKTTPSEVCVVEEFLVPCQTVEGEHVRLSFLA